MRKLLIATVAAITLATAPAQAATSQQWYVNMQNPNKNIAASAHFYGAFWAFKSACGGLTEAGEKIRIRTFIASFERWLVATDRGLWYFDGEGANYNVVVALFDWMTAEPAFFDPRCWDEAGARHNGKWAD